MALAGAAIGAAGSLLAGGLSYYGQRKANKQNVASAREAMHFSHDEYGTQYQRSMEDMRKAGLNPILAAKYGGGGSPSGVSAQSQNEMSGAVSSGLEAKRLKADVELIRENAILSRINQRAVENDMVNKSLSTASQVSLNNAQQDNLDSSTLVNLANAKQIPIKGARDAAFDPLYRAAGKIAADGSSLVGRSYDELTGAISGGLSSVGKTAGKMYRGASGFLAQKSKKHFGK